MAQEWLVSDEVINKYKDGNHQGVNIGIQSVDPSKIIALGLDYNSIKNDFRMNQLKDLVQKNGWNDPSPKTLELVQLPSGEYAVDSGGNHRAVLAKESGQKEIFAKVYRLYPLSIFPQFILDKSHKLLQEKNDILTALETLESSDTVFFDKVTRLDEIDEEIPQLYYNFVKNNGLI